MSGEVDGRRRSATTLSRKLSAACLPTPSYSRSTLSADTLSALRGTRVCALLGREIKGQAFLDLFTAATRSEIRELFAIIANEAVGVAGGASELMAEGPEAARLELLLLPLCHYGRTDTRLLGALAANEPPNWLGIRALRHLELGTYRFVGRTAVPACVHAQRNIPAAKVQSRFTVYEGRQRPSSGPPAT
jgi:hypothetical protein